ncbi:MAG: hypothetical protein ACRDKW_09455, partial [Actinomycetota bacterium]
GSPREVRAEDIVEPAVWMPGVAYDDPNMDYSRWRDLLFATGGHPGDRPGSSRRNRRDNVL